jgi:peroxiredoxin
MRLKVGRWFYGVLAALVVTGGAVVFVFAKQTDETTTLTAMVSGLVNVQGDAAALSDNPAGVVVVNFMAGWCRPCWGEIPGFVEVYEDFKMQGLTVVGISLQTPRDQTQTMIDQLGITYPVYEDATGQVALDRFRLRSMPTTFIFKGGREVERLDGEVSAQQLRDAVEGLL